MGQVASSDNQQQKAYKEIENDTKQLIGKIAVKVVKIMSEDTQDIVSSSVNLASKIYRLSSDVVKKEAEHVSKAVSHYLEDFEPSQAEPSQAEPSQAEPSQVEPSQAEPSQAEPSQAERQN